MTEKSKRNAAEARLEALIAAYGANPARWPAAEREAAARLVDAATAALLANLASARRLDQLLDQAPALAPRWPLSARIIAAAPSTRPGQAPIGLRRRLALGVALAAACAAGVAFGLFATPLGPSATRWPTADVNAVSTLLLADPADTADG